MVEGEIGFECTKLVVFERSTHSFLPWGRVSVPVQIAGRAFKIIGGTHHTYDTKRERYKSENSKRRETKMGHNVAGASRVLQILLARDK